MSLRQGGVRPTTIDLNPWRLSTRGNGDAVHVAELFCFLSREKLLVFASGERLLLTATQRQQNTQGFLCPDGGDIANTTAAATERRAAGRLLPSTSFQIPSISHYSALCHLIPEFEDSPRRRDAFSAFASSQRRQPTDRRGAEPTARLAEVRGGRFSRVS